MSRDIKITFEISEKIGELLAFDDRGRIFEILEPIVESFFSHFSNLNIRCSDLKFQYAYFFNAQPRSIIATLSHVPNSDFSGSAVDKEKLVNTAKNFIVAESKKHNLSAGAERVGISNIIGITCVEFSDAEEKPADLLVDANSFFYIHKQPINEKCERDYFKKKIRATFTPDFTLQEKKVALTTPLPALEIDKSTRVCLFNRNIPINTEKLHETVISFQMLFSREADFGRNATRNKHIETIIPIMILRIHELLQSPILRFAITLRPNENSNIISLPEIKILLLTSREFKLDTDLNEITTAIMKCFSSLDDPSNNLVALLGLPLKMQPLITKEFAFYTEALKPNITSTPCVDDEISISIHPVNIATLPDRVGATVKIEYEFQVARKQLNQAQPAHKTSITIDARKPVDTIFIRDGFGQLKQQTFLPTQGTSNAQLFQTRTPSITTLPILMKPKTLQTTTDTAEKSEEAVLNELLSGKYKTDNPIERKLHVEKAIRNCAHNGYASDLKLFLKFKEKLSFNVDGVAGNGNLKTALHYCVSRSTDQHVECATLLLESGAKLDLKDEKGATAEDIILLKATPAMEELRNKFLQRQSSLAM